LKTFFLFCILAVHLHNSVIWGAENTKWFFLAASFWLFD